MRGSPNICDMSALPPEATSWSIFAAKEGSCIMLIVLGLAISLALSWGSLKIWPMPMPSFPAISWSMIFCTSARPFLRSALSGSTWRPSSYAITASGY